MIHWSFHTSNLELQIGALNGIAYQSYKNGPFKQWLTTNAHTEPLFKQLHLQKVNDIFDAQCLTFWYKLVNKKLPHFRDMFKYNYELHDIHTRSHDRLHFASGARNILRHHIPELLYKFPEYLIDRIKTHNLYSISYHIKCYLINLYSYNCGIIECQICNDKEWQFDQVELGFRGWPVIISCCPSSRNDNPQSQ